MGIQQLLLGGHRSLSEGQETFTTTGSHTWTVPAGVTSVSVVCIGAGGASGMNGGGGGALAYGNDISVTAGSTISLQVGLHSQSGTGNTSGSSFFNSLTTLRAGGAVNMTGGASSGSERDGGGDGGMDGHGDNIGGVGPRL